MHRRVWLRFAALASVPSLLGGQPLAVGTGSHIDARAIDTFVEREMAEAGIPGLSLAIVHRDRVIHVRGYGRADPTGRSVTPETLFCLGSVSKSFTALAVMQLVEEGRLELDIPVQQIIPWFRTAAPEVSSRITVRHLLSHTSGLSTRTGRVHLARHDPAPSAGEFLVRSLIHEDLLHPPGEAFVYSNANYVILGLLIETITKTSYGSYIVKNLFRPLEMGKSSSDPVEARLRDPATGHRLWFGYPIAFDGSPVNRGLVPAGSLYSSASDLAHYLIAHLQEGRFRGRQVLSSTGMGELHRPGLGGHAMGWFVSRWRDTTLIELHHGDCEHYHSELLLDPGRGWGVAVLLNANSMVLRSRVERFMPGILALIDGSPLQIRQEAWTSRFYYLGLLLLIVGQITTLSWYLLGPGRIRQRSGAPQPRAASRSIMFWMGLDLLPISLLFIVPALFEAPLEVICLYQPDLSCLVGISVFLSMLVGPLRAWRKLRGSFLPPATPRVP